MMKPTVHAFPKNFREMTKKEFRPAQAWYVYVQYIDPSTGTMIQKRYKKDLNRIKTLQERRLQLSAFVAMFTKWIEQGWNPATGFPDADHVEINTLGQALDHIFDIKKATIRQRSIYNYTYTLNTFKTWLRQKRLLDDPPAAFSEKEARSFMDYLVVTKKYKGKTHNNVLTDLRVFFNAMVDRDILKKNPFRGIKKKPVEVGRNLAFTPEEVAVLDKALKNLNPRLYYFKEFIYSAGIRRTELTKIRVCDVKDTDIVLRADVSKNRKQESVAINPRLRAILQEMNLKAYSPNDYIFGRGLQTGPDRFINPNHISTAHRKIVELCGDKIRPECTLYSWKHTAGVNLYAATRDPYLIMKFFRHHSLEMTMIYLKSLGIDMDDRLKEIRF